MLFFVCSAIGRNDLHDLTNLLYLLSQFLRCLFYVSEKCFLTDLLYLVNCMLDAALCVIGKNYFSGVNNSHFGLIQLI